MSTLITPLVMPCELRVPPPLQPRQIHLYVAAVTELAPGYLNGEEQQRAARFLDPRHGDRFTRIRSTLRALLAHYLHCAPQDVALSYTRHGKPVLRDLAIPHFNLSHSRSLAAFVFGLDGPLGVDIEYVRPQKNLTGMLRHIASPREQAQLTALPAPAAQQAFYRLWTRKEALIKGIGRGLGMGLRRIHIGIDEHSPRPVEYDDEPLPPWFVLDQPAPIDYKLALSGHAIVEP